jgi:hypothetical protein
MFMSRRIVAGAARYGAADATPRCAAAVTPEPLPPPRHFAIFDAAAAPRVAAEQASYAVAAFCRHAQHTPRVCFTPRLMFTPPPRSMLPPPDDTLIDTRRLLRFAQTRYAAAARR